LIENDPADISELPEIIRQWETSLRLDAIRSRENRLQANKPASLAAPPPPPTPPTEPIAELVDESQAAVLPRSTSSTSNASESVDLPPAQVNDEIQDGADTIVVGGLTAASPPQGEANWAPVVPENITIVWQWKQSASDQGNSDPPPNGQGEYELEWVGAVGYRVYDGTARARVCVKWHGWPLSDTTWEPLWKVTDWSDAPENVAALKKRVKDQAVADGFGFEDLPAD